MKNTLTTILVIVCMQAFAIDKVVVAETDTNNPNALKESEHIAIKIPAERLTLKEAFRIISQETGFKFIYLENQIPVKKKVSIESDLKNLKQVLMSLSRQTHVAFRRINDRILVSMITTHTPSLVENIIEKNIKIAGSVTDAENGEALVGVYVVLTGTKIGTMTDADGFYKIDLPDNATQLTFSYVGYQSITVDIGSRNTIDIALASATRSLDDVVVVGYGVQEKRDVTGAISSVKSKDLEMNPQVSPVMALQGRASGVDIVASNFTPGSDPQIRVRGERSILASNAPLLVVDGIPFQGSLNDISPSDIASIEILKDASSTAIYGSRASNGVLLITTKSGTDKMKINFTSYAGVSSLLKKVDMMNGGQFAQLRREAQRTRTGSETLPSDQASFDPFEQDMLEKGISTDWQDELYGKGAVQNYTLNFQGSTHSLKYYLSGNYMAEDYLIDNVDFRRYSLRINVEHQVNNLFTWGTNTLFSRTKNNLGGLGGTDGIDQVYRTDPLSSSVDSLGRPAFQTSEDPLRFNPLYNTDQNNYIEEKFTTRIFPTVYMQLNFHKDFSYRVNAGGDIRFDRENRYRGKYATSQKGELNDVMVETGERLGYTLENILSYNKKWLDHDLKLMGLFSVQQYQSIVGNMQAAQLKQAPPITFHGIGDAVQFPTVSNNMTRSQLASYMLRANYSFKGKYLVTATARYDGSSVFAEGNKWGFFPSVGLGWQLGDEPFITDLGLFSDLKLRASYGVTGNQSISPFDSQSGLSGTKYRFGDLDGGGFQIGTIANKDLGWEKTHQLDAGTDMSFLNGRLVLTIDYYYAITTDLLYKRRIPAVTGFSVISSNIGTTQNTGFEFHLQSIFVDKTNIKWSFDVNFAANRNKILDLYGDKNTNDVGNNLFIGSPLKVFYDNRLEGIWQTEEKDAAAFYGYKPGDIKMADLNTSGSIDSEDREVLGSQFPKLTGGLSSTLNVYAFDLNFFWITRQKFLAKNEFNERYNTLVSRDGNVNIDYWTPENPSQTAPRPHRDDEPDNLRLLTYEDASFVRLKNVSIGYSFPSKILSKTHAQKLRVYISMLNPITITKFQGVDPEQPAFTGGTKYAQAGNYRQTTLGLNLTF